MPLTEKEKKAKESVDRREKINLIYRQKEELDRIKKELDSASAFAGVGKKDSNITEIFNKMVAQEKKLKLANDDILNSKDSKLVSDYKQTLTEDKDLGEAVKFSPKQTKKKAMPDTKKSDKIRFEGSNLINKRGERVKIAENASKEDVDSLKLQLKRIELEKGIDSPEYEAFQRQMYQKVIIPTMRKVYGEEVKKAQEKYDNADNEKDLISSKKRLDNTTKLYNTTNVERWKGLQPDGENTEDAVASYDRFLRQVGELEADPFTFEDDEPVKEDAVEEEVTPEGEEEVVVEEEPIETRGKEETKTDDSLGEDATKGKTDYQAIADKRKEEIAALDAIEADQFEFDYKPDSQSDSTLVGDLMDTGRGIAGLQGAMTEVPEYERGTMWNKAMDSADRRSEEGLSADELNYRNQQSETAYAYDVKNVRRGAGGSSGAYLGNLGRAQSQLYQNYGQTAGVDEQARRVNQANFQAMAGKDEVINRQIFEDDLSQALETKRQGAALVGDAIKNIEERQQYKKKYGKDSAQYAYKKALTKDMESNIYHRDKSAKGKADEARRKLVKERDDALAEIGNKDEIGNEQNDTKVIETQEKANTGVAEDTNVMPTGGTGGNLAEATINEPVVDPDSPEYGQNIEIGTSEDKGVGDESFIGKKGTGTQKSGMTSRTETPYTETDEDGNVQTFNSKDEANKIIEDNISKTEPKKNKDRYKALKEAEKYGEMAEKELVELENLEEAKKNGWRIPKKGETRSDFMSRINGTPPYMQDNSTWDGKSWVKNS